MTETETERAIQHYRRLEVDRELTDEEERRLVALLRCQAEDAEADRYDAEAGHLT